MSETNQPPEEQAREIIRTWLTAQNRSLRNLAGEAGIQPSVLSRFLNGKTVLDVSSALKLYTILQQGMNLHDRQRFIETMNLLPLAAALSRDGLFLIEPHISAYGVSSRLFLTGLDLHEQAAYEQAITVLRAAEGVLEGGSSQAAFIGCTIAQMLINLGDYRKAQDEADRVQQTYELLIDPETKAELYRVHNWITYYQGYYAQAEHWQRERIKIGEETSIARLTNPHFLGRMYYDLGCCAKGPKEADALFHKAALCFDQSYQINLRWADDHNQAFDLFRQSQVLQKQGNWREAERLRKRTRQMFGNGSIAGSIALFQLELEEALLLLADGQVNRPKGMAENALRGWAHIKYPKGIGDSLEVLGDLAYMQGQPEEALAIFAARLCVYPYDCYPTTRRVWEEVDNLHLEIIQREGRTYYQKLVQRIQQQAEHHQGYFSYLNQIVPDRSTDLARVLSSLRSLSV